MNPLRTLNSLRDLASLAEMFGLATKADVGALKSDVGALKSDMSAFKSDMGAFKSQTTRPWLMFARCLFNGGAAEMRGQSRDRDAEYCG